MNIIEQLWYGNICPSETPIGKGTEYAKASYRAAQECEQVLQLLPPEQRRRVETLLDIQREAAVLAERDAFVHGFRLGVQMILDGTREMPFLE